MPTNVEIKAVLNDPAYARAIAGRLSGSLPETIRQEDHFFRSAEQRLKLRIFGPNQGELIRYERPDIAGIRGSHYLIARTADPQNLLEILSATLGIAGVVRKVRTLYMIGQTRIHIDQVEGLGNFLELEVVLQSGQSEAEGGKIAAGLLSEFGIHRQQFIAGAYIDLLLRQAIIGDSPGADCEALR